jgi:GT2 family glycosyltransferase
MLHEYLPGLHLDSNVAADDVVRTVCANGAAMLVRRDRHLELGGFDETFFMEWEDLDLCWRAWLRGWSTVYVPRAILRHRVGAVTTEAVAPQRSASSHHNLLRFALKCLPLSAAARVVAGELLRAPRHAAAVSRALGAVAGEIPEIIRERRSARPSSSLLRELLSLDSPLP